jgi:predicted SAM-dependent methyltransferase
MFKKFIPIRVKASIMVLLGIARAVPVRNYIPGPESERSFRCPVCREKVSFFHRLPDFYLKIQDEVGYVHPVFQMETMNLLSYSCPNCGASDRERLYALYFQHIFKPKVANFKLLDIAPDKPLQKFVKKYFSDFEYRTADLMKEDVDDRVDITKMDIYPDNHFDFFICSHVLEHVEEDRKAMKELFRILKPGGQGIVMVPILLSLTEDYVTPEAKTENDRWKYYGQHDHVRMYSKPGFIAKLKDAGFTVQEFNKDTFGVSLFNTSGVHMRSVLYVVEKLDKTGE